MPLQNPDEGVLYFTAFARLRLHFSQGVLSSRAPARLALAADLHLLGAHSVAVSAGEFAGPVRLELVEQRLVDHAQRGGRRSDALASFDQPHGLWLELERVTRSSESSSSFRSPCVD